VTTTLARFTQLARPPSGRCAGSSARRPANAVSEESTGRRIAPRYRCERLGLGAGWGRNREQTLEVYVSHVRFRFSRGG
jgi:hypothetical protein